MTVREAVAIVRASFTGIEPASSVGRALALVCASAEGGDDDRVNLKLAEAVREQAATIAAQADQIVSLSKS